MIPGAVWHRNLEHEGIQISFLGKPPQEILIKLKAMGFRWSPRQKIWYGKGAPTNWLNEVAEYGGELGASLTFAEKQELKGARAGERAERYAEKAEKLKTEGAALIEKSHKMGDIIPFGQPILVDHHSEGPDRRYRDKIQRTFLKGADSLEQADEYARKAETLSRPENSGTMLRRVEKLKAERRRHLGELDRQLDHIEKGFDSQLSRAGLEYAEAQVDKLDEMIEYWEKRIDESGVKVWGPRDFHKGEQIKTRFGWAEVIKPNKKTVKVRFLAYASDDWRQDADFSKVPYTELGRNCKEDLC